MPHIRPTIDIQRTGLRARLISADSDKLFCEGGIWYGPPGAVQRMLNMDGTLWGFAHCCPGCGKCNPLMTCDGGGFPAQERWDLRGNPAKVRTMSWSPDMHETCCGWHGFLRRGVFLVYARVLPGGAD